MSVKSYIIKVKEKEIRNRSLIRHLKESLIDPVCVEGYDAEKFDVNDYFNYAFKAWVSTGEDFMSPGEVACSLSHQEGLRYIVESGDDGGFVLGGS